jgi:hypothetical protein
MKMQTMIDYMRTHLAPVVAEGWRSKAAYEVALQVRLDTIVRTHLSTNVGRADTDKDGSGVLVQKDSKGKVASTSAALKSAIATVDEDDWEKMREITYPISKEIADEYVHNKRFVVDPGDPGKLTFKNTYYWIEMKAESPQTGKFGGYSLAQAISFDSRKLEKQKEYDDEKFKLATTSRRRYWVIMIAVSEDKRGDLKNTALTVVDVPQGKYTVAIGCKEI